MIVIHDEGYALFQKIKYLQIDDIIKIRCFAQVQYFKIAAIEVLKHRAIANQEPAQGSKQILNISCNYPYSERRGVNTRYKVSAYLLEGLEIMSVNASLSALDDSLSLNAFPAIAESLY